MDELSLIIKKNYCSADKIASEPCYQWMQNDGYYLNQTALRMYCQQVPNDALCHGINGNAEQLTGTPAPQLSPMIILIFILVVVLYLVLHKSTIKENVDADSK